VCSPRKRNLIRLSWRRSLILVRRFLQLSQTNFSQTLFPKSTKEVRRPIVIAPSHGLTDLLEASTMSPDTDEGVFGSGSLQLLSTILSNPSSRHFGHSSEPLSQRSAPSPGLIRRTLLSILKLPQALAQPHQESESQISNSVVLTKLDGGGSYHSAPIGDGDLQVQYHRPLFLISTRNLR
jgi:hypothetical protein